jgi:hypothetical protein
MPRRAARAVTAHQISGFDRLRFAVCSFENRPHAARILRQAF